MERAVSREELVEMLRVLYAEVRAHEEDYHYVTPPERLAPVRRLLLDLDGRLPDPAPLPRPEPVPGGPEGGPGTGDP